MAEIDENRAPLFPRELRVGRRWYQVKLHRGDARAVVEDAAVADDDDPRLGDDLIEGEESRSTPG
jgi:hypothetical protein